MSKEEFPVLTNKIISETEILFEFNCGDLWYRENVDKSEDISKSIDQLKKELPTLKVKKFEKLNLILKYTAPTPPQLDEIKKDRSNKYKVERTNHHILCPLIYGDIDPGTDNHKTFFVDEDLINTDYELIFDVANLLKDLKVVNFWSYNLNDGFLATDVDQDEFIQSELNNPSWWTQIIEIKENYVEPDENIGEKFGNDLDGLLYLRKNLGDHIQMKFDQIDKEEEEILKKHQII